MLLEEVSLTIPAGKRIGLIGADDLEKHALVYLIPRLLDPTSGEIRIDQHNLRWVTLDSLRDQIAMVLQHNLVFHDTVANNIGCGDPAYTLPQIIEAAKIGPRPPLHPEAAAGLRDAHRRAGPFADHQRAVPHRPGPGHPARPGPAHHRGAGDAAGRGHQVAAGRHAGPRPAGPDGHLPAAPHLDDPLVRQLFLLHKGRIAASGVHKELLPSNPLYRHLHYLEFNEIDEQM